MKSRMPKRRSNRKQESQGPEDCSGAAPPSSDTQSSTTTPSRGRESSPRHRALLRTSSSREVADGNEPRKTDHQIDEVTGNTANRRSTNSTAASLNSSESPSSKIKERGEKHEGKARRGKEITSRHGEWRGERMRKSQT